MHAPSDIINNMELLILLNCKVHMWGAYLKNFSILKEALVQLKKYISLPSTYKNLWFSFLFQLFHFIILLFIYTDGRKHICFLNR